MEHGCPEGTGKENYDLSPSNGQGLVMSQREALIATALGISGGAALPVDFLLPGTVVIGSVADKALILETAAATGGRTFVGRLGDLAYRSPGLGRFANTAWARFSAWRGDTILSVTAREQIGNGMLKTEINIFEEAGRAVVFPGP